MRMGSSSNQARTTRSTGEKAIVRPVPARTEQGYRWQWRSVDGACVSANAFDLFYDCLDDARKHGYEVELPPSPASAQSR